MMESISQIANSFNPSYTGCATGSGAKVNRNGENVRFQSFLYWMCYWKIW